MSARTEPVNLYSFSGFKSKAMCAIGGNFCNYRGCSEKKNYSKYNFSNSNDSFNMKYYSKSFLVSIVSVKNKEKCIIVILVRSLQFYRRINACNYQLTKLEIGGTVGQQVQLLPHSSRVPETKLKSV